MYSRKIHESECVFQYRQSTLANTALNSVHVHSALRNISKHFEQKGSYTSSVYKYGHAPVHAQRQVGKNGDDVVEICFSAQIVLHFCLFCIFSVVLIVINEYSEFVRSPPNP